MEKEKVDDGSLAFLNIPRDVNSRSFNCEQIQQSRLSNMSFWVFDYIDDVETRYSKAKGSKGQMLVKIKFEKDDSEEKARKFFTGSQDIKYVLQKIKELNAFPRRVTMRSSGNRFWLE